MGCNSSKSFDNNDKNFDNVMPDNITYKECVAFVPPVTGGRIVRVYDGDSITIASKLPGLSDSPIYRFPVRLNGIDCPEIRGKSEDEKSIAHKAQEALSDKIMGKYVHLKNVKTEKYGRLLCEVYIDKVPSISHYTIYTTLHHTTPHYTTLHHNYTKLYHNYTHTIPHYTTHIR